MWSLIKSNVLAPLATRLGTSIAGALVAYGMNADHAAQVGVGLTAAVLVAWDLFWAWRRKAGIEASAVNRVLNAVIQRDVP